MFNHPVPDWDRGRSFCRGFRPVIREPPSSASPVFYSPSSFIASLIGSCGLLRSLAADPGLMREGQQDDLLQMGMGTFVHMASLLFWPIAPNHPHTHTHTTATHTSQRTDFLTDGRRVDSFKASGWKLT